MSIKITKRFKAASGTAPFTYTWTSDDSCVSIEGSTGSFTTDFETTFEFADTSCLSAASIILSINDSSGCSYSQPVTFSNPCDEFVVEEISKVSNNVFSIYANQDSNYDWVYDTKLYDAEVVNNVITLIPKFVVTPSEDSVLMCYVKNIYGCEDVKLYTIQYERIVNPDIQVVVETDCYKKNARFYLQLPTNQNIDWSTFSLITPDNITIESKTDNKIWISVVNYPNNGQETQQVVLKYTVKNYDGILSKENIILLYIKGCVDVTLPTAYSPNIMLTSTDIGTNGESPVIKNPDVYINTLVPIPGSGQTLVNAYQMTTPYGIVNINEEKITYEITGAVSGNSELIQYTVRDSDGNISKVVQVTVSWNAVAAPVPPLNPLVLCTECGNATPYINYASYATGNVDPTKTEIVSLPSTGELDQLNSGSISFSSENVFMAGNTFTFNVTSYDGVQSSGVGTVNVINRCSGVPINTVSNITCSALAFNLEDLADGYLSSPRLWEDYDGAYTAAGGTITNATAAGGVNFTGLPSGTYKFKQTNTFTLTGDPINCKTTYTSVFEIYIGDYEAILVSGGIQITDDVNNPKEFQINIVEGTVAPDKVEVILNGTVQNIFVNVFPTYIVFRLYIPDQPTNELEVNITDNCGNVIPLSLTI